MKILDGKMVAQQLKDEIKKEVDSILLKGESLPCLACVIVGDDPASKVYVASKEKACKSVGILSRVIQMHSSSSEDDVIRVINELNNDKTVTAILLQLPLPKHLNQDKIVNTISPTKDVDALSYLSLGKLFSGKQEIAPCTASGVIDLLEYYNIDLKGKNVAVIGRSLLVGKSVSILFEQHNATVTICHSKTQNIADITKNADIIVVAIGKSKFLTSDMIKNDAIVVDVGINRVDGKIIGDVDFDCVKDKCSYISPVPGGVGPMTIAELLQNTLTLYKNN